MGKDCSYIHIFHILSDYFLIWNNYKLKVKSLETHFGEHVNSIPGVGSQSYLTGLGPSDSGVAVGLGTGHWDAAYWERF